MKLYNYVNDFIQWRGYVNNMKHVKHGTPIPTIRNRFKRCEDPDRRMENFLRGRGEFSPEADMRFNREMEQVRMDRSTGLR